MKTFTPAELAKAIGYQPGVTIDVSDATLGEPITIAGVGEGLRGQMLVNGVNPLTGRKCRSVGPMRLVVRAPVQHKVSGG